MGWAVRVVRGRSGFGLGIAHSSVIAGERQLGAACLEPCGWVEWFGTAPRKGRPRESPRNSSRTGSPRNSTRLSSSAAAGGVVNQCGAPSCGKVVTYRFFFSHSLTPARSVCVSSLRETSLLLALFRLYGRNRARAREWGNTRASRSRSGSLSSVSRVSRVSDSDTRSRSGGRVSLSAPSSALARSQLYQDQSLSHAARELCKCEAGNVRTCVPHLRTKYIHSCPHAQYRDR